MPDRIDGGGRKAHLLTGQIDPVEHGSRRNGAARPPRAALRSSGRTRASRAMQTRWPRRRESRVPSAAGSRLGGPRDPQRRLERFAVFRRLDDDADVGRVGASLMCDLRTVAMIDAASSRARFPAPVPIGGTVRRSNSHSRARSSADSHARATASRVTGSVSLWMTAWIMNSAGRFPPPAVTTAAPTARSLCRRNRLRNSDPPIVSSRRTDGCGGIEAGQWRDERSRPSRGTRGRPRPLGSPAGRLPRAPVHADGVLRPLQAVEDDPQSVQRARCWGSSSTARS